MRTQTADDQDQAHRNADQGSDRIAVHSAISSPS
jgi:hypothetical protein